MFFVVDLKSYSNYPCKLQSAQKVENNLWLEIFYSFVFGHSNYSFRMASSKNKEKWSHQKAYGATANFDFIETVAEDYHAPK